MTEIVAEDRARAELYGLLSALLAAPPTSETLAACAAIQGDPATPIGAGLTALAAAAGRTDADQAEREFNALFIGLGRGELLPYLSHYLTGNLNDRPLAALRRDMGRLGISRAPDVLDPEDNIASILEMMRGQIVGAYGPPAALDAQAAFFKAHLAPFASRFFADLEQAKGAQVYAPVGTLGLAFIDVETRAFAME